MKQLLHKGKHDLVQRQFHLAETQALKNIRGDAALCFRCRDLHCSHAQADLTEKQRRAQRTPALGWRTHRSASRMATDGPGQGNQTYTCIDTAIPSAFLLVPQYFHRNRSKLLTRHPLTPRCYAVEKEVKARESLIPRHSICFFSDNSLYLPRTLPTAV